VKLGVNHGLGCCKKKTIKNKLVQLEVVSSLFVDKFVVSGQLVRSGLALKEGSRVK
jgi:hypothetical protein